MEALIENLSMAVYMARVAGERLPDDPCAPPIVAGTPKAISERLARQGDSSGSLRGLGMISQMEKGSKCYVAAVGLMRAAAEELQAEEGGERNLTPASGAATAEAFRNLAQYARSLTGNVDGTEWGNGPEEVGGTHAKGMLMIGKLNEDEVPAAARDAAASGAGSAAAAAKGRGADAPGTVRFDPLYAWTRCAVSRLQDSTMKMIRYYLPPEDEANSASLLGFGFGGGGGGEADDGRMETLYPATLAREAGTAGVRCIRWCDAAIRCLVDAGYRGSRGGLRGFYAALGSLQPINALKESSPLWEGGARGATTVGEALGIDTVAQIAAASAMAAALWLGDRPQCMKARAPAAMSRMYPEECGETYPGGWEEHDVSHERHLASIVESSVSVARQLLGCMGVSPGHALQKGAMRELGPPKATERNIRILKCVQELLEAACISAQELAEFANRPGAIPLMSGLSGSLTKVLGGLIETAAMFELLCLPLLLKRPERALGHRYGQYSDAVQAACPWVSEDYGTMAPLTCAAQTIMAVRLLVGGQSDAARGASKALPPQVAPWEPNWVELFQLQIAVATCHPNLLTAGAAARGAALVLQHVPQDVLKGPPQLGFDPSTGAESELSGEMEALMKMLGQQAGMPAQQQAWENGMQTVLDRLWRAVLQRDDVVAAVAAGAAGESESKVSGSGGKAQGTRGRRGRRGKSKSKAQSTNKPGYVAVDPFAGAMPKGCYSSAEALGQGLLMCMSRPVVARESFLWVGAVELSIAACLRGLGISQSDGVRLPRVLDVICQRFEADKEGDYTGLAKYDSAEMEVRPTKGPTKWHEGPIMWHKGPRPGQMVGPQETTGRAVWLLSKVRSGQRRAMLVQMREAAIRTKLAHG